MNETGYVTLRDSSACQVRDLPRRGFSQSPGFPTKSGTLGLCAKHVLSTPTGLDQARALRARMNHFGVHDVVGSLTQGALAALATLGSGNNAYGVTKPR